MTSEVWHRQKRSSARCSKKQKEKATLAGGLQYCSCVRNTRLTGRAVLVAGYRLFDVIDDLSLGRDRSCGLNAA
jgi:hypothetical protein